MVAWVSQTFSSNSTFTVPAGVYVLLAEGCGGGGGGAGGMYGVVNVNIAGLGGGGGGGTIKRQLWVPVTPGTTYTITIGQGGQFGTGGVHTGTNPTDGSDGYDSTISLGGTVIALFPGAQGGKADRQQRTTNQYESYSAPGANKAGVNVVLAGTGAQTAFRDFEAGPLSGFIMPHSYGGPGGTLNGLKGNPSLDGLAGGLGGTAGTQAGSIFGGGGGGGGGGSPYLANLGAAGGNGGAASNSTTGGAGQPGGPGVIGGGGGGGGGGGSSVSTAGDGANGGPGGPGQIIIYYLQ